LLVENNDIRIELDSYVNLISNKELVNKDTILTQREVLSNALDAKNCLEQKLADLNRQNAK